MKKLYTLAFGASCLFAISAHTQCSVSISASLDTLCSGQTTALTANTVGPPNAVSTTMAAGNNHRGNMFDITAINSVTITSFDASPMSATTIEIYYKTGTWVGFNNNSAAWTLIGSAAVPGVVLPTPVPVPVPVNITIPAGQTYAFYVTSTNTAVSLNYTDGTSVGNVFASDANIQFREGAGLEYPFSGSPFTPRIWNGVIHYTTGSTSFLWNTSATTSTITEVVNASTQYTVEANIPGCPSTVYDTIDIFVPVPVVDAGQDFSICEGMLAVLSGTGNVSQYLWDQGVTNNVPFAPLFPQLYTVTGMDQFGCTDTDSIFVMVNPNPVVGAGPDTTFCFNSMLTLSGTGAIAYTWSGGITDGVPFAVTSTATYEVIGQDINGCTDNDSVTVTSHTVDATTTVLNETITANDSGATYQWIDCNTMLPIAGETNQSFTATVNGSYAVIVTDSICSDTSACEIILSTGIENYGAGTISLYPNPTGGAFTLNTGAVAAKIVITDLSGRVLDSFVPQSPQLTVSLNGQECGVYFVIVTLTSNTITTVKVVKE